MSQKLSRTSLILRFLLDLSALLWPAWDANPPRLVVHHLLADLQLLLLVGLGMALLGQGVSRPAIRARWGVRR